MQTCRSWFQTLMWTLLAGSLLVWAPASVLAQESIALKSSVKVGRLQKVRVVLKAEGHLKVKVEGGKLQQQPIRVDGTMQYDELLLALDEQSRRSIRYYHQAQASLRVDEATHHPVLRKTRRLIGVQTGYEKAVEKNRKNPEAATIFSPQGTLTREELDLIDVPFNSLYTDRLLPGKSLAQGENAKLPDNALVALLGMDKLTDSEVTISLAKVENDIAKIKFKGTVNGVIRGALTDISLNGQYAYDLKTSRIGSVTLEIVEKRQIGHAGPGLDVTARLTLEMTPLKTSPHLSNKSLASLALKPKPVSTLLRFNSNTGLYRLWYDRRWHMMHETGQGAFFRMVDEGDLIAQCKVIPLVKLRAGQDRMTPEKFKQHVAKALGKNLRRIHDTVELPGHKDYNVLSVVATGTVADVPIQWNYYFTSDAAGHQASLVVSLDSSKTKQLKQSDQMLARSLRFSQSKNQDKPKTADKRPEAAEQ